MVELSWVLQRMHQFADCLKINIVINTKSKISRFLSQYFKHTYQLSIRKHNFDKISLMSKEIFWEFGLGGILTIPWRRIDGLLWIHNGFSSEMDGSQNEKPSNIHDDQGMNKISWT